MMLWLWMIRLADKAGLVRRSTVNLLDGWFTR